MGFVALQENNRHVSPYRHDDYSLPNSSTDLKDKFGKLLVLTSLIFSKDPCKSNLPGHSHSQDLSMCKNLCVVKHIGYVIHFRMKPPCLPETILDAERLNLLEMIGRSTSKKLLPYFIYSLP